jgi:hypothetical protein
MFYVITLPACRVMGFKSDIRSAQQIVECLGEGAEYEEMEGPYPRDEWTMALTIERYKRGKGLRLVV